MEGVVLLTRIVPGGAGPGRPPQAQGRHRYGDPLALGVAQVLLGALQVALGGTLLGALGDPLGAQWGAPLGTGGLLLVSGSLLVTLEKRPSVGMARVGVAVGGVSSCCLLLALLGQGLSLGLSLSHHCPQCHQLGPAGTGALLGVQVLLLLMGVAGAGLAVTGTVVAGRGGAKGERPPMVIYQTALPGAGLAETTPPAATSE
ncbi:uncharacterized protein LOC135576833 isoform X1 [Columba livia]|uniref:uncharacterized protein LOC135576833 isoform X1 n=1 Tax=Columba livia TaxID=8932 RepID=UPI0031BB5B96